MEATTAVRPERAGTTREALARRWAKVKLPLAAAPIGGVVGVVGSYLFWTTETLISKAQGVPLTGDLYNYGFGGVRLYTLPLALATTVYGALVLRRPSLRTDQHGRALGRIGLGLAAIPVIWMLTIVFFEGLSISQVGPGPWVVLAGGVVVWLAARTLIQEAPTAAKPVAWERRTRGNDLTVVLAVELIGFVTFVYGVKVEDPGEFLGYFVGLVAAILALGGLGVLKGLTGPFERERAAAIGAMVVLLVVFPPLQQALSGDTFWVRVAAQAGIFVVAALGLNIVVGSAGLLDLGYVAFFGIGAYVAALVGNAGLAQFQFPHVPFLLVLLVLAPVVAAIFGVLLGAPTLRLRGDYLAIVTLGFGEIVRITLNNLDALTGGPNGIASIPAPELFGNSMSDDLVIGPLTLSGNAQYFYLTLLLIALVLLVIYRLNDSRVGRAWVAVREDEVAAAAMGINTTVIKLLAFGAGAFFAGMAGSVDAHFGTQVSPDSYVFQISVLILAMVVLGGIGNPPGVALGAALLIFLPEKLRDLSDIRFLVFGLALVFIMRFRPEGLLPSARRRSELRAGGEEAAAESQQLFDVRGT
ncbi:MAG TPA: branched-chain amino acid ABC transporter permease [Actinomycetes bacterium]|nr:branched-chain amino acid ABC transporter permease [Actinomycetes bacterium]